MLAIQSGMKKKKINTESQLASANKSMIQTDSVKSNQHILSIQDIVDNNSDIINWLR